MYVCMYSCVYECARLKVHRVIQERRRTRRGEKGKEDARMQLSELRSSGLTYRKLVYVFSNCRVAEGTDTRGSSSRSLLTRVEKTITLNLHCTLTRELTKILFFHCKKVFFSLSLIYHSTVPNGELCDSDTRNKKTK